MSRDQCIDSVEKFKADRTGSQIFYEGFVRPSQSATQATSARSEAIGRFQANSDGLSLSDNAGYGENAT